MSKVKLMPHQERILESLEGFNRCVLAMDMGTGKTHTSTEKLAQLDFHYAMVICQKSMVSTWVKHLKENYPEWLVIDYTKARARIPDKKCVLVFNYDIVFRRPELFDLTNLTVILDECTAISNIGAKRTKAIMKLDIRNIIMLSGTISKGKYECLVPIVRLCGWNISRGEFYSKYVIEKEIAVKNVPYPVKIVVGYKNVDFLKYMLRKIGFRFLKTEEVLKLPEQTFMNIPINVTSQYKKFKKDSVVTIDGQTLVGDMTLTKMLYERMLCGHLNKDKLNALKDLLNSTDDRVIIFYNFNEELKAIKSIVGDRPISEVNGSKKNLNNYEVVDNTVVLCQYQAAAKGLNLQKANKIVYFTPTLSCEDWMQSQKRIHRIGQSQPCFYYTLTCENSIEEKIYKALERGEDYTNRLFQEDNPQ